MSTDLAPTDEPMNMTLRTSHLISLLNRVSYKNWKFKIEEKGSGHLLQCVLDAKQSNGDNWTGRKWYISPHAIDAEVIGTALKAVLTSEEHEAREQFLFDGVAIFGPHLSLEALLANANNLVTR